MIQQYRPFLDRPSLAKEVSDYLLGDGYLTEYKKTEEFEQALAKFLDVKYCTVVANGTVSIVLALLASGVKNGDAVLVPNITMIATSNAVKLIGAKPIFIDVDNRNSCMDLKKAKNYIDNCDVKAIIYVTLNGRCHSKMEYTTFKKYCIANKVKLIEDNAQSLGSCHEGITKISCPENGVGSFSFSMPKIITTGQGGCLVTNDEDLGYKLKKMKDFGRIAPGVDVHDEFGINCKFTEISAIIGLNQLKNINWRISRKKEIYDFYYKELSGNYQIGMFDRPFTHTPWFVDIYIQNREGLYQFLKDKGIAARAVYPELTSQEINKAWLQPKSLKNSKTIADQGLWLPSSLDLTNNDLKFICDSIKEFYGKV